MYSKPLGFVLKPRTYENYKKKNIVNPKWFDLKKMIKHDLYTKLFQKTCKTIMRMKWHDECKNFLKHHYVHNAIMNYELKSTNNDVNVHKNDNFGSNGWNYDVIA